MAIDEPNEEELLKIYLTEADRLKGLLRQLVVACQAYLDADCEFEQKPLLHQMELATQAARLELGMLTPEQVKLFNQQLYEALNDPEKSGEAMKAINDYTRASMR